VRDEAPDVPLRTSDVWLERVLDRAAANRKIDTEAFVDRVMSEAVVAANPPEELALLEGVAVAFGIAAPHSMKEIGELTKRVQELKRRASKYAATWKPTLARLREANLDRFLAARPEWAWVDGTEGDGENPKLTEKRGELVSALREFMAQDAKTTARHRSLRSHAAGAKAAAWRMEAREAALLRARTLLVRMAGTTYLSRQGSEKERETLRRLTECEALRLNVGAVRSREIPAKEPFPSFEADAAKIAAARPSWIGLRFEPAAKGGGVDEGVAKVLEVKADSPAAAAGLKPGDLIVGPPEAPFDEPHRLREWAMLAPSGKPARLSVIRDGETLEVTLTPVPLE
jgi:hypothetical protein